MKLPTSNKTSNFTKPLIKKGYYPAQLLKIDLFKDKEGNAKIGKHGKQLIFEFAIYKGEGDDNAPVELMTFKIDEDSNVLENVIIPKFVYHEYKVRNPKEGEPKFQTAITPNSAITKLLIALGWTFSIEDVDLEDFIGNWTEVNVDDFEFGEGDGKYTASTINKITAYKGPKISDDMGCVKHKEKKDVKKQVKHEAVKESDKPISEDVNKEIKAIEKNIANMKQMNKDGFVSDGGLKQAIEQLETKIEELKKK